MEKTNRKTRTISGIIFILIMLSTYIICKLSNNPPSQSQAPKPTLEQIIEGRPEAKKYIALLNSDKIKQSIIYKAERQPYSEYCLQIYIKEAWHFSPYDEKMEFLTVIHYQWAKANGGEGWVEILDYRTGKRLAKYDVLGAKIYN